MNPCPRCNGDGVVEAFTADDEPYIDECPRCEGSGADVGL